LLNTVRWDFQTTLLDRKEVVRPGHVKRVGEGIIVKKGAGRQTASHAPTARSSVEHFLPANTSMGKTTIFTKNRALPI
jgi:hypothetical protein